MKVIDLIRHSGPSAFSFEVLPPVRGTGIEKLYAEVDKLMDFGPKYINITTHRSEYVYRLTQAGLYERILRTRRPGTVAVAAALHNRYGITTVPHVVCSGFSREENEEQLMDLQFLGITDLLVLRGDKAAHEAEFCPHPHGHTHAIGLMEQINRFNEGWLTDGTAVKRNGTPFSYGVACYPEKHAEAPNNEQDIRWLKQKIETGAEYAVTQLFFDNRRYFDFVERARKEGIEVPIIPGIKPISRRAQLTRLPRTFRTEIPEELAAELLKCKDDEQAAQVGTEWCIAQCRELMEYGVPSIHFYTAGGAESVRRVAKAIY